ncbi:hypothetical protein FYW06_27885 [Bacillus paranthracis]|uniref:Uncharacterized protein n=1 Tax=Bacillus paranthracis TaxID=2026186 RepID=A0A5M9GFU9_9BACI|nr:hypothetical protein [Bacillus paranthracis]KAA8473266.1 hypothetical protein FYW06_27885 [Bacillus paranthracis]QPA42233.1 hypothetical protein INR14_29535 [Bacillus paranthracis]
MRYPIHIYSHTEKFKHIFDLDRLKSLDSSCKTDLKRLQEAIQEVQAYRLELFNHAQQISDVEFEKVVVIQRYSRDKIKYEVRLECRPKIEKDYIDNEIVYIACKERKIFAGKERRLAIKHAEKLAKTNNAVIETKGFKIK